MVQIGAHTVEWDLRPMVVSEWGWPQKMGKGFDSLMGFLVLVEIVILHHV